MPLNQKQQALLVAFQELLEFGYSVLESVQLHPDKVRLKKKILYMMMGAVQSYSEAIYKLVCSSPIFDEATEVILRSLIEASINVDYIYSKRDESRARIFVVHSLRDRIEFAEKFKSFKEKYPDWKLAFDGFEELTDWEEFISNKEKEVKKIEKMYNQSFPSKFPSVRNRAICADNYLRRQGELVENRSQEALYVKYYKFFSHVAHLTFPGLERFFDRHDSAVTIDGKLEDMERVASVAYPSG